METSAPTGPHLLLKAGLAGGWGRGGDLHESTLQCDVQPLCAQQTCSTTKYLHRNLKLTLIRSGSSKSAMGACGSKRTSAAAEDDWPAAPPPASRDAERAHASGIVRYESASQSSMTRMHAAASSQLPTSNIDSVSSGTPIDHVASRSTSAQTGVEQQRSSTSEAPSPYPTSAVNEAHPTTPPESPAPPSDNDASHIKTSDANQTEPPNLDAISGDELLRV